MANCSGHILACFESLKLMACSQGKSAARQRVPIGGQNRLAELSLFRHQFILIVCRERDSGTEKGNNSKWRICCVIGAFLPVNTDNKCLL